MSSEGPIRSALTTNLKYDVQYQVDEEIYQNPPQAEDVLDKRITSPQNSLFKQVKNDTGKVIMAVNHLAHPSKAKVVDTTLSSYTPGGVIDKGKRGIKWTYIIQGVGIGEDANTRTTSRNIWELHEVIMKGDNSHISNASAIREFETGPLEPIRINIATE